MAEHVQQSLESMISELEQLQRVQLLDADEVRSLLKRRKRFEYQLQKRNKRKEDFLHYIQYELGLLSLIQIRREKISYQHKKDEIDYAIARRINKMYKILEHRFADDVDIWISHIEFLKRMKWNETVGKIFHRMLQVHINNEELYVAAAKFELEELGNAENARNFMFKGLRFHPKSEYLYTEYFRLELMYVEQLHKRSSVLGLSDVSEDCKDNVLKAEVAKAAFNAAAKAVSDARFIASLLPLAKKFEFATELEKHMEEHLLETYPTKAVVWDTLARLCLVPRREDDEDSGDLDRMNTYYEDGMTKAEDEAGLVCRRYIDTLLELLALPSTGAFVAEWISRKLVSLMRKAEKMDILDEEDMMDFQHILNNCKSE